MLNCVPKPWHCPNEEEYNRTIVVHHRAMAQQARTALR